MRLLIWIFRIVLFVFLFGFAIKNDELVNVQFFFGEVRQFPLIFVMLAFFAGGALIGASITSVSTLARRREISKLRKRLKHAEDLAADRALVVHDGAHAPEAH
ncbi:MAG: LapA family protein [Rhodocyclaceae bacterium]|nr:LapA family protein [Rhodocyclaceae bacterium]